MNLAPEKAVILSDTTVIASPISSDRLARFSENRGFSLLKAGK